ncbi:MAG: hypothetical protein VYE44_01340, partial [Verrucomicrobiota bacterium]|nr:hypothetical protein [Verrucomicrobiota bacterium]
KKVVKENGVVGPAYDLMRRPPEFELYDLKNDPYEFRNLANDDSFHDQFAALKNELIKWRRATNDPFLNPQNIIRLQAEIIASMREGKPDKKHLKLNYWNYFFE